MPSRTTNWLAAGDTDGRRCAICSDLLRRRKFERHVENVSVYKRRLWCSVGCFYKYKAWWQDPSGPPWSTGADGCWTWDGARTSSGYGNVLVGGKPMLAHVWLYEEIVGPTPAGLELDHLCRNRACCNPEHLEPVTHAVNMQRSCIAKLNAEAVRDIRESSDSTNELALRFGVANSTICRVRSGAMWPMERAA